MLILNIVGYVLFFWMAIVIAFGGPELYAKGFYNRFLELLDKYRYALALLVLGAFLTGIK